MNEPLENNFITQVESLRGFNFQDFINRLYLLKYGNKNFIPTRKVKDKGSDGIILPEKELLLVTRQMIINLKISSKKLKTIIPYLPRI